MMEKQVYRQLLDDARKALTNDRLNDVLIILRSLCKECGDKKIMNDVESVESNYQAMLDYIANGGVDKHIDENLQKLLKKAFDIYTTLEEQLLLDAYQYSLHPELYEPNFVHHEKLEEVFYKVFSKRTNLFETEQIPGDTMELLFQSMHVIDIANVVNAYWIGQPDTLDTLISCCNDEDQSRLNLTGIVLTTMLHPEIFKFYPKLKDEVERIFNDEQFQEPILTIYNEISLSSLAEHIEQHMKDDMMPMMIEASKDERLQREMNEEMLNGDEEIDSFEIMMKENELTPLTPEQRKKKKLLQSAMNELIDIHNEGIDINTEIFNYAARLPFFSEIANWFMPFNPHHPAVESICYPNGKPNIMFRMLYDVPSLCDIDKYAMTLIMGKKLKSSNMEAIISDIQHIMEESQSLKGMDFVMPRKTEKEQIAEFIHTLYRFVTKSPWKNEVPNIFAQELPFCTDKILSIPLTKNTYAALNMADKMWKFGAKKEAVKIYKFVDEQNRNMDVERCLRVFKFYDEQFLNEGDEYIDRAMAIDDNDKYVLYAAARKYQRHGDYEKRIEVLRKLIDLYPEESKAISELAESYIFINQWDKANQEFYRLEYIGRKISYAQRGIVLCSINLHKYDVALRYSRKLFNMPGVATMKDYLHGGHAAWLMNDMTSALTFYHLYIKNYLKDDTSITDALEPFNQDAEWLMSLGKTHTDISLMRDLITIKAI